VISSDLVGVGFGLVIVTIIEGAMIGAFYSLDKDIWEGIVNVLASTIITLMVTALTSCLQAPGKMESQDRRSHRLKWAHGLPPLRRCERYALFVLPFITVLREGLEAVAFVGGVGIGIPASSFLYLVVAGLFSKGAWLFQTRQWKLIVGGDSSEVGSGPGSYSIRWSVWHVNCCNPELGGGGGFNAVFGWANSATYGSVIWIFVSVTFLTMRYNEFSGH